MKRETKRILVVVVKRHHRANGLLGFLVLGNDVYCPITLC